MGQNDGLVDISPLLVYANGSSILDLAGRPSVQYVQDAICYVYTFPRFCPAPTKQLPTRTALHIKGLRACGVHGCSYDRNHHRSAVSLLLVVVIYINQFLQIYNGSSLLYTVFTELRLLQPLGNYKENLQCFTIGFLVITVGIGNFLAATYTKILRLLSDQLHYRKNPKNYT